MKQEPALYAESHSRQTNIQKAKPVPENAQVAYAEITSIRPVGRQPVYNMEVDGFHNFSVNGGIIVHNCMDATRYFVNTTQIWREKKEYKSIFK